jgi:hypothetical protein
MSKPTYTELDQTVRLLFTSYIRTVATVQADWFGSSDAETSVQRACTGVFSTLERDATDLPDLSVSDLVDQLRHMGLVSDDQTTST